MSFPTRAVPRRGHGTSVCPGRASPLEHYNPPSFYQTASPGNFHAARKGLHGDYLGRWCSPAAAECPPVPLCPSVRPSFRWGGGGPGRAGVWGGRREGEEGGRKRREGEEGGKEGQRPAGPAAHTDRPSPGAAAAGTRRRQPAPGRTGQVGTGGAAGRRGAEG